MFCELEGEASLANASRQVETRQIELQVRRSVGDTLQSEALEMRCDLIVAGAFGHSRITERVFGGVTRHLLDRMKIPLLLSY